MNVGGFLNGSIYFEIEYKMGGILLRTRPAMEVLYIEFYKEYIAFNDKLLRVN